MYLFTISRVSKLLLHVCKSTRAHWPKMKLKKQQNKQKHETSSCNKRNNSLCLFLPKFPRQNAPNTSRKQQEINTWPLVCVIHSQNFAKFANRSLPSGNFQPIVYEYLQLLHFWTNQRNLYSGIKQTWLDAGLTPRGALCVESAVFDRDGYQPKSDVTRGYTRYLGCYM